MKDLTFLGNGSISKLIEYLPNENKEYLKLVLANKDVDLSSFSVDNLFAAFRFYQYIDRYDKCKEIIDLLLEKDNLSINQKARLVDFISFFEGKYKLSSLRELCHYVKDNQKDVNKTLLFEIKYSFKIADIKTPNSYMNEVIEIENKAALSHKSDLLRYSIEFKILEKDQVWCKSMNPDFKFMETVKTFKPLIIKDLKEHFKSNKKEFFNHLEDLLTKDSYIIFSSYMYYVLLEFLDDILKE